MRSSAFAPSARPSAASLLGLPCGRRLRSSFSATFSATRSRRIAATRARGRSLAPRPGCSPAPLDDCRLPFVQCTAKVARTMYEQQVQHTNNTDDRPAPAPTSPTAATAPASPPGPRQALRRPLGPARPRPRRRARHRPRPARPQRRGQDHRDPHPHHALRAHQGSAIGRRHRRRAQTRPASGAASASPRSRPPSTG